MSSCSWYARLVFLQYELLRAEAVVLYVRRPVQHAWIKVESLQSTVTAHLCFIQLGHFEQLNSSSSKALLRWYMRTCVSVNWTCKQTFTGKKSQDADNN